MSQSQRHMFRPQMSLFIPSVTATTSEEQIQHVFHNLNIGVVSRVDFVERDTSKAGGRYMAFVHFEYWFLNNTSYHLQEKIVNEGQGRIVYNDPYYWIVMENSNPRTKTEIELGNKVAELQKRITYLEKVIGTHTRKFIENGIVTQTYPCSECWTVSLEDTEKCDACGFVKEENTFTVPEAEPSAEPSAEQSAEQSLEDNAACLAMTGALNSKSNNQLTALVQGGSVDSGFETVPQQNENQSEQAQVEGGWWPWS